MAPHAARENWPWQTNIFFTANDTLAFAVEEAVTIEETGMYYLWFVIWYATTRRTPAPPPRPAASPRRPRA